MNIELRNSATDTVYQGGKLTSNGSTACGRLIIKVRKGTKMKLVGIAGAKAETVEARKTVICVRKMRLES